MMVAAAEPADARAIAGIQVRTWQAAYRGIVPDDCLAAMHLDKYEKIWSETIRKGVPEVLVAKDGGEAVGWVSFAASRDTGASATEAEIWAFYVDAARWGQGVGRRLWQRAQARMLAAGFNEVSLWAFPENVRAAAFYRAVGFAADASTTKTFTLGGRQMREIRFARALERPLTVVRRLAAHEWPRYRDLRLRALADSPDAFGSTFAAESALSDQDWAARLARGAGSETQLPVVAEVDGVAAGLAWARFGVDEAGVAHLYQMWVDPAFRGQGVGQALLARAIEWARERAARALVLGATCGDTAAWRLYARAGFMPAGAPAPLRPGSALLAQPLRLALADGDA